MKHKKYIIIIILVLVNLVVIGSVKTFSAYRSSKNGSSSIDLAKIVFNNEELTSLSLALDDLMPGVTKDFLFQVKNYTDTDNSEITVGYTIQIETLRLIPLEMKLYEGETLLLTCDGNSPRTNGKIVCTSSEYILNYTDTVSKNYKIEVNFPSTDSDGNLWSNGYSGISDYVDIYINSYQKK